ncbi:acyltransferase domain-containing protein, partial [Streptomyces sp. NPDC051776]|uniref:acyltransferase domain-containing protein n=1 Tax=Streptomyces sp. NPDC051776 TaxID=3155414 RepID=UPI00342DD1A4
WSLADACRLVAARGRLMQALPEGGAMLSLQASEGEVLPLLVGREAEAGVAAVNGPRSVVVSGAAGVVEEIAEHFRLLDRKVTSLRVSHAFHSPLMEPMLAEFRGVAESIVYAEPRVAIVSTLTGEVAAADVLMSAEYWVDHVRRPVRFADGVRCLDEQHVTRFVELGPDGTLTVLVQACLEGREYLVAPTLRKDRPEVESLLVAAAQLFTRGGVLDWVAVFGASTVASWVDLPTYAFERRRFWPGSSALPTRHLRSLGLGSAGHPLLGAAVELAGGDELLFTSRLSLVSHEWLRDHVVAGVVVFPGTGFLELALRVGERAGCDRVEDLTILAPLVVPERGGVRVQVRVGAADESGRRMLEVYSRTEDALDSDPWTLHVTGELSVVAGAFSAGSFDFGVWPPRGAVVESVEGAYERFAGLGLS